MPSVTGVTKELADIIMNQSITSALLSPAGDLILVMAGGTQINAGPIGSSLTTKAASSIVTLKAFDMTPQDVVVPEWDVSGVVNPRLPNPATLPANVGRNVAWSPDNVYLAVAHDLGATVPITIYKRSGDIFTKLANPATLPAGHGVSVAWTPDGQYLAHTQYNSPWLIVYKRSGDTFTKLADPASLPGGTRANGDCDWTYDGQYFAMTLNTTPYVAWYKRAGDVLTKLTFPTDARLNNAAPTLAWSNGGQYLALGTQITGTEKLFVLKRSVDTLTLLPALPSQPSQYVSGVAWSPDDRYLGAASYQAGQPGVHIWKRSGDTFTKISGSISQTTGTSRSCHFSPDGKYFVVGGQLPNSVTVYRRTDDTFTKINSTMGGNQDNIDHVRFSPDGAYLACAAEVTPYIAIFKSALGSISSPATKTILDP